MDKERSESFSISILAGLIGVTIGYAFLTDVLGLERRGSLNLYIFSIACVALALIVRIVRLRASDTKVLLVRLPSSQEDEGRKYLGWLFSAAALVAYSCYQLVVDGSGVFVVIGAFSTALVLVLAWELRRART